MTQPSFDCYGGVGSSDVLADCTLPQLVSALGGEGLFALFVGGVAMYVMWEAADHEPAVPATVAILSGGLLLPILPSEYATVARTIMLLGLAAGIYAVARRYAMTPGT